MKSKIVTLLPALVFVIGLVTYVGASMEKTINPFVATFSYYKVDGDPSTSQVWIEKVTSTGKCQTIRYRSVDGELKPLSEDSIFQKWAMPEYPPDMWRSFSSAKFLRTHPEFVRQEQICGLKVYVHRTQSDRDTVERWYAPETGPIPLKTVVDLGDEGIRVAEATRVEFREVTESELQ